SSHILPDTLNVGDGEEGRGPPAHSLSPCPVRADDTSRLRRDDSPTQPSATYAGDREGAVWVARAPLSRAAAPIRLGCRRACTSHSDTLLRSRATRPQL